MKICVVVYAGVNGVTRAILDSICFLSKTPNQAWDLLEYFGWKSYEREEVRETIGTL